jgi:hypothetical protein
MSGEGDIPSRFSRRGPIFLGISPRARWRGGGRISLGGGRKSCDNGIGNFISVFRATWWFLLDETGCSGNLLGVIKTVFDNYLPKWRWIVQVYSPKCEALRPKKQLIGKIFLKQFVFQLPVNKTVFTRRIPPHTVKQNFVAFFVFGETAASFSRKKCSSVTKREAILGFFRRWIVQGMKSTIHAWGAPPEPC